MMRSTSPTTLYAANNCYDKQKRYYDSQREAPARRQIMKQQDPMVDSGQIAKRRSGHDRQFNAQNGEYIKCQQDFDCLFALQEVSEPKSQQRNQPIAHQHIYCGTEHCHPCSWEALD